MSQGKSILILYITERSGHHSAALAIKAALELLDPLTRVSCVNGFKFAFPIAERIIHKIYLAVIHKVPGIWRNLYDNPKVVGRSQRIKDKIHNRGVVKIASLMDKYSPDAVICTQAFPCGLVAHYKRLNSFNIPLFAVLTDFVPHSFWAYDNVDHYIVPCQETKKLLSEKGVPEDKIEPFGIPVDPRFSAHLDIRELFANYGFRQDIPVILLMGGGHGLGPIKNALQDLDESNRELQLIVICGINSSLYNWVTRRRFRNRIICFKFTDQVYKLMSIADLLITKPGGVTSAEALAKRLPMIIVNPIPGQESRNTQMLVNSGVAVKVEDADGLLPAVEEILDSRRQQTGIFAALDRHNDLCKANSAIDLAKFVLEK